MHVIGAAAVLPELGIRRMRREKVAAAEFLQVREDFEDWLLVLEFRITFDERLVKIVGLVAEFDVCDRVDVHELPMLRRPLAASAKRRPHAHLSRAAGGEELHL